MKKILALLVVFITTLVLVACGNNKAKPTTPKTHSDVFALITLPSQTDKDIEIPTTSSVEGASLLWQSSHPDILSVTGKVNRGSEDTLVTLTLTVTLNQKQEKKPYSVKVLKKDQTPVVEKFDVTFDSNEGTEVAPQQILKDAKVVEPEAPTKENYKFLGWFIGETLYDFNTPVTQAMTLTAKWEIISKTFTVTFETNSEGIYADSQIINQDEKAVQPAVPTKNGHTFLGWYTDIETTVLFDFELPITSDITLYAKWEETPKTAINYKKLNDLFNQDLSLVMPTIHSNSYLIEGEDMDGTIYVTIALKDWLLKDYNAYVEVLKTFEGITYDESFDTWLLDNGLEFSITEGNDKENIIYELYIYGEKAAGEDTIAPKILKQTVSYAQAKLIFNIEVEDANLLSLETNFKVNEQLNLTLYADYTNPYGDYLDAYQALGITVVFDYHTWTITFTDSSLETVKQTEDFVLRFIARDTAGNVSGDLADVVLETILPVSFVSVRFDSNGGSEVSSQTLLKHDILEQPENPTKEGHTFVGWQLEGVTYNFSDEVNADITLIAVWEKESNPKFDHIVEEIDAKVLEMFKTIESDIVLPYETSTTNAQISWASSDSDVLTVAGSVNRQKDDVIVILTLYIELDGQTYEKTYEAKVVKLAEPEMFDIFFELEGEVKQIKPYETGSKIVAPNDLVLPEGKEIAHWIIKDTQTIWDFKNDIVSDSITLVVVLKELEDEVYEFDFGTEQNTGYTDRKISIKDQKNTEHNVMIHGVQLVSNAKTGPNGVYLVFNASKVNNKEAFAEFSFEKTVQSLEFKIFDWDPNKGEISRNNRFEIQIKVDGSWVLYQTFDYTSNIVTINDINANEFRILIGNSTSEGRVIIDDLKVTTGKPLPKDEEAPVIKLKETTLEYMIGTEVPNLGAYADVTDNRDKHINVNFTEIDFTKPGTYEVVYTAKDRAGNEAEAKTLTLVIRDLNIKVAEIKQNDNTITVNFAEMLYLDGTAIKDIDLSSNEQKFAFLNKILAPSVFSERMTDAEKIDITITDTQLIITLNDGVFRSEAFKQADTDKNGVIRIEVEAANVYKSHDDKDMNVDFNVFIKYSVPFENGIADYTQLTKPIFQTEAQYLGDKANDPVADSTNPTVSDAKLTYENNKLILQITAQDDHLKSLEIDHTLSSNLEFTVYANNVDPYGSEAANNEFASRGVSVTFIDGVWTITIKQETLLTILDARGITFYYVVKDHAGNAFGSMTPPTDENKIAIKLSKVEFIDTNEQTNESRFVTEGTVIELPTRTHESKLFEGWYETAEFTGDKLDILYKVTKDTKLYAKWNDEVEIVRVTFVTNQDALTIDDSVVEKGTVFTALTPTYQGFKFLGWFEDEALNIPYVAKAIDTNTTLYAKWTQVFIVEFITNNPNVHIDAIEVEIGQLLKKEDLETITLEGYHFVGWFTDQTFTNGFEEQEIDTNIKLYADLRVLNFADIFAEVNVSSETDKDLNLPVTSSANPDAVLTWTSNNDAIATDGKITQGDEDVNVTLTLKINLYGNEESKDYVVKVLKQGSDIPAESQTISYMFTSAKWGTKEDDWINNKDGYQYQSDRGIQVTSGKTGASGTTKISFSNIKEIEVIYSTNSSKGSGTIQVSIGEMIVQDFTVSTVGGTTNRSAGIINVDNLTGNINIIVNCTTNSIYIYSIRIIYN